MPEADVSIVLAGGPPVWPEVERGELVHLPDARLKVALIEGGMASGKPGVALRLDLPDGRTVIAETSLAVLIAITAAARGAFPAEFAGGPFDLFAGGPDDG